MNTVPATITAEVIEHADGRPVAYVDATGVAVFVWQEPDGVYVVEIHTRDDTACGRLQLRLDGWSLTGPSASRTMQLMSAAAPWLRSQAASTG